MCVTELHSGVIPNSSFPKSPWLTEVQKNIAKGEAFLSSGYGSALDSAHFLHELQARELFILTLPIPSSNHPMQKLTDWVQSMAHGKKGRDRGVHHHLEVPLPPLWYCREHKLVISN